MKNIHITEIMNQDELRIIGEADSLEELFPLDEGYSEGIVYVVDGENRLKGTISSKDIMNLLSPGLFFMDSEGRFLDRFRKIRAKEVMNREFRSTGLDVYLSEVLPDLNDCPASMAVCDKAGCLVGEISRESLLNRLFLSPLPAAADAALPGIN
ncbi:MAG: CBS domain-containing protein [Spirochaetales bacterium]|nr:CBS domain-containing protein [Spirochaetales bacterium]